jgi:surface polysaccharide O-acyltransferase-like enzyme
MVLMYHASTEPYNAQLLDSTQYFVLWWSQTIYQSFVILGVPLFVMLSGALLLQPSKTNEPIKVFLKKRLSRIGLAFLFWSVIYFAWNYFVNHQTFTANSVIQSFLSGGAYFQFWFIYLIMGLYLITPVLRIVVAHANRSLIRYLLMLWFIAASLIPLFHLITGFEVDSNLFLFSGWIGYFILGIYLMGTQAKTKTLKRLLAAGIILTILGSWLMAYPFHSLEQYYFFAFTLSANVIISSIALFSLLLKRPADWPGNNHPKFNRLIHAISANTLPIFFLHIIVLETLNKGLLGFRISLMDISPIIEIPIATFVTLFICLGLILLMKKVPVLNKLIG